MLVAGVGSGLRSGGRWLGPAGNPDCKSHAPGGEAAPGAAAQVQDLYKNSSAAAQTRTAAEIMRFFAGFGLVEPGLVYLPLWRPDGGAPEHPERAWFYAGVGRKPA